MRTGLYAFVALLMVCAHPPGLLPVLGQTDLAPGEPASAGGALGEEVEGLPAEDPLDDILNLDVDQLANTNVQENVQIESTPAALTETTRVAVPATVTQITQEDIHNSGARDLFELLDIYVPNFQWIRHHWELGHMGLRGIISDREDKYLLLVNGRVMNDKTHFGAASERDLVLLDDIHHIDVIRGPGSSVVGPGAVSMVISIYTDTAKTFQGTKITGRGGMIDEYTGLEFKSARQWENADGGILFYGGLGTRQGANQFDAPLVIGGNDGTYPFGVPPFDATYTDYQAGENVTPRPSSYTGNTVGVINNDREAYMGQMPLKMYTDITYEDLQIWTRYTRSGYQFEIAPAAGFNFDTDFDQGFGSFVEQNQAQTGLQQITVHSRYDTEVAEDLRFVAQGGWDSMDFARILFNGPDQPAEAYREEELNARALFIWDSFVDHSVAFGCEFYQDWFGLESHMLNAPPTIGRVGGTGFKPWDSQTYSILVEDQWRINDEWTSFLGGRWDNNTYTPWMYSPRAVVVYSPEQTIAWKMLLNRSLRMNFAEELRAGWLNTGLDSDPEILRSYELRHERAPSERFAWALSGFYIDLDAIGWNGAASASTLLGNQTQWGLEAEAFYNTRLCRIGGSHCYTKLVDFTLADPSITSGISASPNGFGDDLANWSNHITKIVAHRQISRSWGADASLRYYWGFPGSEDIQDRINAGPGAFGQTVPGWERSWRESVFFNLGLDYKYNDYVRLRVDGYNLLGGFEKDLNKRNYFGDNSFRSEAPALGLSAEVVY
jgi:outer membrane receptor for ferrienterochelin and colicins